MLGYRTQLEPQNRSTQTNTDSQKNKTDETVADKKFDSHTVKNSLTPEGRQYLKILAEHYNKPGFDNLPLPKLDRRDTVAVHSVKKELTDTSSTYLDKKVEEFRNSPQNKKVINSLRARWEELSAQYPITEKSL